MVIKIVSPLGSLECLAVHGVDWAEVILVKQLLLLKQPCLDYSFVVSTLASSRLKSPCLKFLV